MSNQELQKELRHRELFIRRIKARRDILKREVSRSKVYIKALQKNYERIIKQQRHQIKELLDNAPKLLYLYFMQKCRNFKMRW